MTLPELLPPALSLAGVLLLGLLTAAVLAGRQARPQPVPVRRAPRRH